MTRNRLLQTLNIRIQNRSSIQAEGLMLFKKTTGDAVFFATVKIEINNTS